MVNATRVVDISGFKTAMSYAMNATIKGKGKLMADSCADTSIAAIGNVFVKVSRSDHTVTLVGFDDDLTKKEIPIGSAVTAVELPRKTVLLQLNEAPLLEGGANSLLSTTQA